MLRWFMGMISIAVTLSISSAISANEYLYQDDDLLCGAGFSLESYHQRIQQNAYQQRAMHAESQRAAANQAAAEQKSLEMSKQARRARIEKEARKREELIAKRKAENAARVMSPTVSVQTASKTLKPGK